MRHLGSHLEAVVGEILHYIWDPLGVSGVPQARDEYDGYVGGVVSLLESGAGEQLICAYLTRIADENMGLPDRKGVLPRFRGRFD